MSKEKKPNALYRLVQHGSYDNRRPESFSLLRSQTSPFAFTTLLLYRDAAGRWKLFRRADHIRRLLHDAAALQLCPAEQLTFSAQSIAEHLHNAAREFLSSLNEKVEHVRIRLLLQGDTLELHLSQYQNPWQELPGIKLYPVQLERQIPELKTNLITESIAARDKAEMHECQEALLYDRDGTVREGAWSSVFWVDHQNKLHTTAKKVLPGITRAFVIRHFQTALLEAPIEALYEAREVFVTQSTSGITPVLAIDTAPIGLGKPGAQTLAIQQEYAAALTTEKEYLDV